MGDYLTDLDELYRSDQLPDDQQTRYRALLNKLKDALPVLRKLAWYLPPVSLEG
jgi:hypothetical protein